MKKIKLGDVLDVRRGASLSSDYYSEQGTLIRLTLGNFNYPRGGFQSNTSKKNIYFVGSINPAFILKADDIITPLTEQVSGLLGETAIIPESNKYVQSGDIGLIIPDENKVDKHFVYYLVSSPVIRKQLDAAAQQTKIRHTSPDAIKNCEAWIPEDIATQKRIAALLGALDEKIALNKKINATLEAMAKTLYDYWFVQFDFPDELGRPYKSSGGKMVYNDALGRLIPQGWEVGNVSSLLKKISVPCGLQTSEYRDVGSLPIVDQSKDFIVGYADDKNSECLPEETDVIVFGDHTCVLKYINFPFTIGADGTQCIISNDVKRMPQILFYYSLKNITLKTTGYARHFKFLKDSLIILPSERVANLFQKDVDLKYELIRKNIMESRRLEELRDWLLPMLMNGQLGFKSGD